MATASRAARATGPKEDLYIWEGKDKTGKVVRGEIRATGEAAVQAMLRRQGIQVVKVRKQKMARGGRISEKDIALFTRQLATMMKSGLPLLQAFDIAMKGSGNAALARLLNEIRTDVETGSNLSQAFSKHLAQSRLAKVEHAFAAGLGSDVHGVAAGHDDAGDLLADRHDLVDAHPALVAAALAAFATARSHRLPAAVELVGLEAGLQQGLGGNVDGLLAGA